MLKGSAEKTKLKQSSLCPHKLALAAISQIRSTVCCSKVSCSYTVPTALSNIKSHQEY